MYYTQNLAQYNLRQIKQIPSNIHIPQALLGGISADELTHVLKEYESVLSNLYKLIIQDPSNFDLVCLDITNNLTGRVGPEENKSLKSFHRIEKLFYAMATAPYMDDHIHLKKSETKISNLLKLLYSFKKIGFDIIYEKEYFEISYPDERNLMRVLSAYGHVYSKTDCQTADEHIFISSLLHNDIRYLTDYGHINYTIEDIADICSGMDDRDILREITKFFTDLGYLTIVEYKYNPAYIRYKKAKSAREDVIVVVARNAKLEIHVRLDHINEYTNMLGELNESVLMQTLHKGECGNCGYCGGGLEFSYGGKLYRKCRIICSHSYDNLNREDITSLIKLIRWEIG